MSLRTLLLAAALCPLLIWFLASALWPPPEYRSWEQIREQYTHFDVVMQPAGPGPYLHLGAQAAPAELHSLGHFVAMELPRNSR